MGEVNATICSNCGKATTSKIYDHNWCADCTIEELKATVDIYRDQYQYAEKERSEWVKRYNEESIQKTKYRNAFECLYEKATLK